MMKSKRLFFVLVAAVAIAGLANYWATARGADEAVVSRTGHIDGAYAFDAGDEKKLVGFADNVFLGRVVERVGSESVPTTVPGTKGVQAPDPSPETLFSVEVLKNIKGELRGTVKVSQTGGQVEYAASEDFPEQGVRKGQKVRETVLLEEDPLLKPGQEVLFSTGYDQGKDRYDIVAQPFGDVRVKDAKNREAKVAQFEEAKKNQENPRGK